MKKAFISSLILWGFPVSAGDAYGNIASILSHTDGGNGHGVFMFTLDGERTEVPACSTAGGGKSWALSLEKESGRAIYSLLLSAQARGKKVQVVGRGHCNSWGDREEPRFVNVDN